MSKSTIEENDKKWNSPFTPQVIAQKTINFADIHVEEGKVYWTESRPWEKGQSFIVSRSIEGNITDETTNTFNVSTNVHGYGGGSFIVKNNIIYFHDAITNQVFKKNITQNTISQITTDKGFIYADFSIDRAHKHLYCLRLDKNKKTKFPITQIVRIDIATGLQEVLFSGSDFYSNIRVSADGSKLLFLQWNYPNMPWDENELWVASIEEDFKVTKLYKAFHEQNVSIYQPEWGENNKVYFACDKNNYWNLFELCMLSPSPAKSSPGSAKSSPGSAKSSPGSAKSSPGLTGGTTPIPLFEYPADFGRPLWVAGNKVFSFISSYEIVANCCENGIWKTFLLNTKIN